VITAPVIAADTIPFRFLIAKSSRLLTGMKGEPHEFSTSAARLACIGCDTQIMGLTPYAKGAPMPTNGKCVRCGYRAPVSSFIEASGDGEILAEYIKLPQVVQQPFYKYLSLFRPASGCACQQSKII
jgi:hypothetical protein